MRNDFGEDSNLDKRATGVLRGNLDKNFRKNLGNGCDNRGFIDTNTHFIIIL